MIQVVDVIFTAVATPYWASVLVPVVPGPQRYMVSVVMGMVELVDMLMNVTEVPIGYATVPLAGIVKVPAEAM